MLPYTNNIKLADAISTSLLSHSMQNMHFHSQVLPFRDMKRKMELSFNFLKKIAICFLEVFPIGKTRN